MTKREKDRIESILWGVGVDSYNRFQTFLQMAPKLRGGSYWYALRIAYEGSDNMFQYTDSVKAALRSRKRGKQFLMTRAERNYLQRLPRNISIYRGMTTAELEGENFGVSWSLKRKVAEFFAWKYGRNHDTNHLPKTVKRITIPKSRVVAYFNGRKEYEIIYLAPSKEVKRQGIDVL